MNIEFSLNCALNTFVSDCTATINNLHSAHTTELCDAFTSNNSWLGFGISTLSNIKNYNVAHKVDDLQHQAWTINSLLNQSPSLRGRVNLLDTNFSGSGIRSSESAEHSLFSNIFFGSSYNSFASVGTARELSYTINKVAAIRNQALCLQRIISNFSYYPHT